MTQSETQGLKPCPWCPTMRRETHETEAGTVGIIFHGEGCFFDGRQVLNPNGVKIWNTRAPVDSQGAELAREAYDYFMGPQACGDFTCACGNAEACGVCEIRQRFERWLGGQPDESPAATQMRTACVQAIRGLRHKSEPDESRWNAALYHAETTLESLTLDQVKQKWQ